MSETTTQTVATTGPMTNPTKRKAAKRTAKAAATKSKPAKAAKSEKTPKLERKPKEENLMVFAFRISKDESTALHRAAGPANASRTMRALAAAFAAEDPAAFESIVVEAKKLRA